VAESSPRRFANGVPQGSVSGPLLFIIYINSLAVELSGLGEEGLSQGSFADDLTLWVTSSNIESAGILIQKGLDIVSRWSKKYEMPISKGKSEAILFSNYYKDNNPVLVLDGDVLAYQKTVRLLGVMLNSSLTFEEHITKLKKNCNWRLSQLACIAGSDWGPQISDMRSLYIAYVRSVLEYASSVWSPLLSETRKKELEAVQNKAARIATGCLKTTSIESLLLEANLLPLYVQHNIQTGVSAERCRRFPVGDQIVEMAIKSTPIIRLKEGAGRNKSWQHVSDEVFDRLQMDPKRRDEEGKAKTDTKEGCIDISNREKLLIFSSVAPWNTSKVEKVEFNTGMIQECSKDAELKVKKAITMKTIEKLGYFNTELWTDGSVEDKVGAGAGMIYDKRVCVATVGAPSGYLSSSYRAELVAIDASLKRIQEFCLVEPNTSLLICTDSQSAISALSCGPLLQTEVLNSNIWEKLNWLVGVGNVSKIVFQFVYSHCGVKRNEEVDREVARVLVEMKEMQNTAPIALMAVKAHVKMELRNSWKDKIEESSHRYQICKKAYSNINDKSLSRKEQVLLAQLRCGECNKVGKYLTRLGKSLGVCRWCGDAEETVYHLYEKCSNSKIRNLRKEIGIKGSKSLVKDGIKAIEFLYKALEILK
jgi:ribonuclease HI